MDTRRKFDVIAVGELNVDLILNGIHGFPEIGKEILANEMTLTLGSSTAIFAANTAALGAKVAFLGKTGNDLFGQFVKEALHEKKVDTSLLITSEVSKTGATVVMNYNEDRANVTHMGAMATLSIADIKPEVLAQARHIHFSSCFLQPGIKDSLGEFFAMAKENGCTTSLDSQWDPEERWDLDLPKILPYVDIFMPNLQELLLLTNTSTIQQALEVLRPMANTIIIKDGSRGAVLAQSDGVIKRKKAFLNINVKDAIGAGDSFNAGFISRFIQAEPLEKCVDFGNLMGAVNTTSAGGTGAFRSKDHIIQIASNHFGVKIRI
ncbi:MAG TPA: carbohydrate kinase family protein [Bacteroidales bacterium]|nr:carbohydrate kinase family protein [Bacteroidales bacterium]